jgi:hypothetical protein
MISKKEIGGLLKAQRVKVGKSLRQAAHEASIVHSHLSKVEDGSINTTAAVLIRILKSIEASKCLTDRVIGSDNSALIARILTESGVKFHRQSISEFVVHMPSKKGIIIKVNE